MIAIWNNILHVLNTLPVWLAAILVGWAMSFSITHAFKFMVPHSVDEALRHDLSRIVAFMSGAAFAAWWAVEAKYGLMGITAVAVFSGIWSPVAYALAVAALRKSSKTAWIADILTADKRGVLIAKMASWRLGSKIPKGTPTPKDLP